MLSRAPMTNTIHSTLSLNKSNNSRVRSHAFINNPKSSSIVQKHRTSTHKNLLQQSNSLQVDVDMKTENNSSQQQQQQSIEVFGNRIGKSGEYPAVPKERVFWVDTLEMLEKLIEEIDRVSHFRDDDEDEEGDEAAMKPSKIGENKKHKAVIGLDCEWKPGDNTPVALLQVATRENVYLIDMFAMMTCQKGSIESERAFEERFLKVLFERENVLKLGFGFDYDIKRMRMSYPQLEETFSMDRRNKGWIDVRELAYVADAVSSHNKRKYKHQKRIGLAALTKDLLKCTLDKKCQVSDWSLRPLTEPQQRYAATDAYSLISIFDACLFSKGGWKNSFDDEIEEDGMNLLDFVQYGGGNEGVDGGKFMKRVSKSKLAKMEKAAFLKRQNSSSLRNSRETSLDEAKADIVRCVTECLGFGVTGRRGAIELLSENGCSVRLPKKTNSKIDKWENAFAIFLAVGEPKKQQSFRPFKEEGQDKDIVVCLDDAEKFFGEDRDAFRRVSECKNGDGGVAVVLFAKRGTKGKYVFCGRLENSRVDVDSSNSASRGSALNLTLIDGGKMRKSEKFHEVIGCHL